MKRHLLTMAAVLFLPLTGCGQRAPQPDNSPAARQAAVSAQIQQVQNDRSIPAQDKAKIIAGIQAKQGK